jgi:hypothetical protein
VALASEGVDVVSVGRDADREWEGGMTTEREQRECNGDWLRELSAFALGRKP